MDDQERHQQRTQATVTPQLVQSLHSLDATVRLNATAQIRQLLSVQPDPPIGEIIQSGIVRQLVHFLEDTRYPELHLEAAYILARISSGNSARTQVVIEAGAIPVLIRLLPASLLTASSNVSVIEAALWALGNIAMDSAQARDAVLDHNLLPPLLDLFNGHLSMSLMRRATWTLYCLWVKDPPPNFEKVSQCLPMLGRLIFKEDPEVLRYVCRALAFFCAVPTEQKQAVINLGVCRRAVMLLDHPSTDVVSGAVLLVGHMVGNELQTQDVINANALPALVRLLSHGIETIVLVACLTVANIAAGTHQQIQALIEANLIFPLIELLAHRGFTVRKEAARAITNATRGGRQQIVHIVQSGAIPPLCQVLADTDSQLVSLVLTGLDRILQSGKEAARTVGGNENEYATIVQQCGGIEKLSALSANGDLVLREKASLIMANYF